MSGYAQLNMDLIAIVSADSQQRQTSYDRHFYITDTSGNASATLDQTVPPGTVDMPMRIQDRMLHAYSLLIQSTADIKIRFSLDGEYISLTAREDTTYASVSTPGVAATKLAMMILLGCDVTEVYISNDGTESATVSAAAVGNKTAVDAGLALSVDKLWFLGTAAINPADQTFRVQNSGDGSFTWAIANSGSFPAWLAMTPLTGGVNDLVTANVSTNAASNGVSSFDVSIVAAGVEDSPQTLTVYRIVQG
jgi:hypothetical protein